MREIDVSVACRVDADSDLFIVLVQRAESAVMLAGDSGLKRLFFIFLCSIIAFASIECRLFI
jgi:hypothetical protein